MVTRRFFLIASSAKSLGQIADVRPGMSLHQFLDSNEKNEVCGDKIYMQISSSDSIASENDLLIISCGVLPSRCSISFVRSSDRAATMQRKQEHVIASLKHHNPLVLEMKRFNDL